MDAIKKRARGLLAVELIKRRYPTMAGCVLEGREDDSAAIQALIAALAPPEGYVLVPVEGSEAEIRAMAEALDYPSTYMGGPSEQSRRKAIRARQAMLSARPEVP